MSQFRKKPVVIEATQWFKDGDHPAVIRKTDPDRYADEGVPWVPTLEGGHIVTPGDWIITGVKGEHYPCKPEIFALTYDPATAPTPSGAPADTTKALRELQEAVEQVKAAPTAYEGKAAWGRVDAASEAARAALAGAPAVQEGGA